MLVGIIGDRKLETKFAGWKGIVTLNGKVIKRSQLFNRDDRYLVITELTANGYTFGDEKNYYWRFIASFTEEDWNALSEDDKLRWLR